MHNIPMIMRRKESKTYGTAQLIEGIYQKGCKALIIEDIISSGSSILETAIALKSAGIEVSDAIVFLNREQRGQNNLKEFDINVNRY
jgi:uridine monophosphate synthetase